MKNRREKKDGFVLMIVVVTIGLIGIEMFVLTGGSNTLLFQANDAYLRAVGQNMIASGLAWAKKNIENENIESFNKTVPLEIGDISVTKATISIIIEQPDNEQARVEINASCNRGRQTFRHQKKYYVGL